MNNRFAYQRMFLMQMWARQTVEFGPFARLASPDPAWSDGWGGGIGPTDWAVYHLGG